MTDLLELAERCEAATGPDRGLDYQLDYVRCDWPVIPPPPTSEEWAELERMEDVPQSYTASIDAATALVPKGMDWSAGSWGLTESRPFARVDRGVGSYAASPALALCAAALRARASQ